MILQEAAKDALSLGKMTVGLGAARALRPQVGRPTAAIRSKEDET